MIYSKKLYILFIIFIGFYFQCASRQDSTGNAQLNSRLSPEVITAWKKSGALVGWLVQSEFGAWQYLRDKPKYVPSLPVFVLQRYIPGRIAQLPKPSLPFAIGLGGTGMNNTGLRELAKFQNLQSLDISHTKVTDSGLKQLISNKGLRSLDLGASMVTDAGLKELSKISHLQKLYFGSTAVSDTGVKHLSRLSNLHTLYLYNTKITDTSLKYIAQFKNLQSLLISKTKVTTRGIEELRKARPYLRVMH